MMKPAVYAFSAVLLLGCQPQRFPPPEPEPAATVPVQPAAVPVPSVAQRRLDGVARYFGAPLAAADVSVRQVGQPAVLATARAAADGTFQLVLPDGLPDGALIQVLADGAGHRVANVGVVPARRLLQLAPLVLDEAQTAALLVLGPRLVAALQVGTEAARRAALDAFQAAAAVLGSQAGLEPASFDAAVAVALAPDGQVRQTEEVRVTLARAIPEAAVAAVSAQADALAVAIRDAVAAGQPRPDPALTGLLPIGSHQVSPVFVEPIAPEPEVEGVNGVGGGSSGSAHIITESRSAALDLTATDGAYVAPAQAVTGVAE